MFFLDNTTDRLTLGLITKSMSDNDIRKSMYNSGLVQVLRMVNKPGSAPFQEKFWVRPDQVQATDKVLYRPPVEEVKPDYAPKKTKEDKWKPIEFPESFHTENLITSDTKLPKGTKMDKPLKKMINHGLDILVNERFAWFMSEQSCDMDVHISSIDNGMVTLQVVTSLYADEVTDSDKRDLKNALTWDAFDNADQEIELYEENGQLAAKTTINFKDIVEVYRDIEV